MDLDDIHQHWQAWAKQYGASLRATTKTSTAKVMEWDALARALKAIDTTTTQRLEILEVGCGNGQNCFKLLEWHPRAVVTGIDFVDEMIDAANAVKREKRIPDERLRFLVGNVLELSLPFESFDVVVTDRCLINLNTDSLQHDAIARLAKVLKVNGHLLMIENSKQTYDNQNRARESVGLQARVPAEFNHFLDEVKLLPLLESIGLQVLDIEDFISLHDLVLYVLVPMMNGGKVEYDHPMVEAATRLNIAMSSRNRGGLGTYGQNRFYKCRKARHSI
jgi:ubiquinone/menaquinone biosynthesis C-methylase UbiE